MVCASNKEFWTTQKQFWEWVREGIVTQTGDRPLTGKFEGRREKLLILVNHIVLDQAANRQLVESFLASVTPTAVSASR